jgi:hypothetical protein
MRKPIAGILLGFALAAAARAHGMANSDWWGPLPVEISVHVVSAATGEPIPDALVRLTSLDEPRPRMWARGTPAEQFTDSTGTAVIHVELDASGRTKATATWELRGSLEVSREGYRSSSDWLANAYGGFYPIDVQALDLRIVLTPSVDGTEAAPTPLIPVGFDFTGAYVFNGKRYRSDPFIWAYPSIVEAIASSGLIDPQLQTYIDEYRKKVCRTRTMFWSGFAVLLGGGAAELGLFLKDDRSPAELTVGVICGGIGIAGGVVSFIAMFRPGPPVEVVDYYNRTHD